MSDHSLTYQERYMLSRVLAQDKIGGLRMDGNHFGLSERVLQNRGLIAVKELSGDDAGIWLLTMTDKGRSIPQDTEVNNGQ